MSKLIYATPEAHAYWTKVLIAYSTYCIIALIIAFIVGGPAWLLFLIGVAVTILTYALGEHYGINRQVNEPTQETTDDHSRIPQV